MHCGAAKRRIRKLVVTNPAIGFSNHADHERSTLERSFPRPPVQDGGSGTGLVRMAKPEGRRDGRSECSTARIG